jgi:hypothetical protein
MSVAAQIAKILESGKVTLSANNVEELQVNIKDKKIELNALHKEFLKDTLKQMQTPSTETAEEGKKIKTGGMRNIQNALSSLREIAENLQNEGLTFTLSIQGDKVVTVGAQAKPKLSNIITRTRAIEINNTRKLIELAL